MSGIKIINKIRIMKKFGTIDASLSERYKIIDVTSNTHHPFIKFSPFYPDDGPIPVPFWPGKFSKTVEGVWQGLKVFKDDGVDESKFKISNMKNLKRKGIPLGHFRNDTQSLLNLYLARKLIYLPSYRYKLEHYLSEEIKMLKDIVFNTPVILLDFSVNASLTNHKEPLSHAQLIKHYLENEWESLR